jgi:hypothetical protein
MKMNFLKLLRSLEIENPDAITSIILSSQDEKLKLLIMSWLSTEEDIVNNELYMKAIMPYTFHQNPDLRLYAYETLATNGAETYYPLIREYAIGESKKRGEDRRANAINFLESYLPTHEEEIIDILSVMLDEGEWGVKFFAYETMIEIENERAKAKLRQIRESIKDESFQNDIRRIHRMKEISE